jgi:hypothetical protein
MRKRERLCTLRKGEHQITLDRRDVPAMGEELIFSVNESWRRMRVFPHEGLLLSAAVAETWPGSRRGGLARLAKTKLARFR